MVDDYRVRPSSPSTWRARRSTTAACGARRSRASVRVARQGASSTSRGRRIRCRTAAPIVHTRRIRAGRARRDPDRTEREELADASRKLHRLVRDAGTGVPGPQELLVEDRPGHGRPGRDGVPRRQATVAARSRCAGRARSPGGTLRARLAGLAAGRLGEVAVGDGPVLDVGAGDRAVLDLLAGDQRAGDRATSAADRHQQRCSDHEDSGRAGGTPGLREAHDQQRHRRRWESDGTPSTRGGLHGPEQRRRAPVEDRGPSHHVREGGFEPPRPFGHWHLKPARLPFRHSRVKRAQAIPAARFCPNRGEGVPRSRGRPRYDRRSPAPAGRSSCRAAGR